MVIISPAFDDADPLAGANGARAPRPAPAANNSDPAAAWSLFDIVHGTTATAAGVGAGTSPWQSSHPPCYAGSGGAYASSSSFPPPLPPPLQLQSHGDDLDGYAGSSIMDHTSFPPLPAPPAVYMQPELSYLYYPQEPPQGFPSSCFAAPFALEPTTIWPQLLQVPTTQPASMPPPPPSSLYYPRTQATETGSASVEEEASPALADTTKPAPRRRGRPSKRAALAMSEPPPAVSKPTKRVAVGSNRAASSTTSRRTSSAAAATGSATMSSSAAGQVVPHQSGASSSSTGSTSDQQAAIAPAPELTAATGPPSSYADTSAVGVRFVPTDQQLIGYLRMKHARQQMLPVKFFKEFDVYQAHPMEIKGACGESQDGCWYAFSPRGRKYRNGKRPARSVFAEGGGGEQVGFWKSNSKLGAVREGGRKDGAVIGRMTSLTFQLGRQPRGTQTGWKMKEYTIPENQHQPDGSAMLLNDWVVCKLFYKERPTCTKNTESKKDKDAKSVRQKRPRRSRKSKKEKNAIAIPVAVWKEGDGTGETTGESMQGEEGAQPQMVPAAHQACDYSEQDLCVEDYVVCDVAFAQQNDGANCTT